MQNKSVDLAVTGRRDYGSVSRIRSFRFALSGLLSVVRTEPNIAIHAAVSIGVIIAGILRGLDSSKWAAIALAIGLVWVAEIMNTGIEKLCDHVCEGKFHPAIKQVKDIPAAAVLVAAITSVVIGIIVFIL